MADIQVEIQGRDAISATEELLSISGLSGTWEPATSEAEKGESLVTIATIVAIAGGTLAIAEQIRKWYKEYKQGNGKKIEKVLIVGHNGGRGLLENATIEQIKQILDESHRNDLVTCYNQGT